MTTTERLKRIRKIVERDPFWAVDEGRGKGAVLSLRDARTVLRLVQPQLRRRNRRR